MNKVPNGAPTFFHLFIGLRHGLEFRVVGNQLFEGASLAQRSYCETSPVMVELFMVRCGLTENPTVCTFRTLEHEFNWRRSKNALTSDSP